jgi:hypothetical protein
MTRNTGFGPSAQHSLDLVLEMVNDFRFAEACVYMFELNRWHTEEWAWVKNELLLKVSAPMLSIASTIVRCSESADLSACEYIIPGLSQYSVKSWNPQRLD